MTIEIVPSGSPAGAEIYGVDIAAGVDDATFELIREALHRYAVVAIRGQRLTGQQQVEFSRRFGPLEPHVLPRFLVPGSRDLICISNIIGADGEPIGVADAGRVWHTDGHFSERPNLYSLLYAIEIPHDDRGRPLGSTWFVHTAEAYDRLDAETRRRLDGLKAENSLEAVHALLRRLNPDIKRGPLTEEARRIVVHPVIRTHPVTGRRCIYVSTAATLRIVGMQDDESRALIDRLQAHCVEPDGIYRHQWAVGDVLIWDNCSAQHLANADYALPQRRLLHRTTILGSVPY
ncbi:MAG: TauD/TfdA dioxygenase family protein [Lautropia sp.]